MQKKEKERFYVLRMKKEIPLRQVFTMVYSVLSLENCDSEQQTEATSMIVWEVTVTEVTKGFLILV